MAFGPTATSRYSPAGMSSFSSQGPGVLIEPAVTTIFEGQRATVRRLRKAKLVVLTGTEAGKEFDVEKTRISAGRSIINDLVLPDKAVSGTHFEVRSDDAGYMLRDLESTNGTFVGDLRIKEVWLKPGTIFRAGNVQIRFQPMTDVVDIQLSQRDRFELLLGASTKMREIFATLEKVSPSDLTVLITGETGTGKEMVARAIHARSTRKQKPFVVLDCSAIPKDLMESTVFGHEKGSFTGAVGQHKGAFEQANGGTIFLDEIGERDLTLQPKLLRVLENREIKRVGGDRTMKIDVRVLAATNRELRQMVNQGGFREDLFFRLSVISVELPSLADRRDDIPQLVEHFLADVSERRGMKLEMSPEAIQQLQRHAWPGNVRELRNIVERASSLCDGPVVRREDLAFGRSEPGVPPPPGHSSPGLRTETGAAIGPPPEELRGLEFKDAKQRVVDAFERAYLRDLLQRHEGNITRSAQEAGLTRYHLRELLKRHALVSPADAVD